MEEQNYWVDISRRRLSRRQVLKGAARVGLGVVGISILGCAVPVTTTTGGTLRMAQKSMTGQDPPNPMSGYDKYQTINMYQGLLSQDAKGNLVPALALSYEVPEPTVVVWKLRKGVKFHDGTDFNAQAVKVNADRLLNPESKMRRRSRLTTSAKSADVIDDYTVKYNLVPPGAASIFSLASVVDLGMVSPTAMKENKNDFRQRGVGTGPFEFHEWVLDNRVAIKKFVNYWDKGRPYLDQVISRVVPDQTVANTMLKAGELDLLPELEPKDVAVLKTDPNLEVQLAVATSRMELMLDHREGPFKNKALRQALAYAIDKESIAKGVFMGQNPVAQGFFAPSLWVHNPNIRGYPYDLAKAKEKLKEGGAPDGFSFTVILGTERATDMMMAEAMKEMLAKAGIKLELMVVEQAQVSSFWSTKGKVPPHARISESGSGTIDPHQIMESNMHPAWGSQPQARIAEASDKALEAMLVKANATYDREERKKLYWEIEKKVVEDVYSALEIVFSVGRVAYRKKLKGFVPSFDVDVTYFGDAWLQK
ncbi:MAG: ABC transporter substrate-binding protein [Chloroflexi bacterium]|nr:ABC transporter substrate-binding protein [Chloroflexota bacterium]